jgi:hypothetical protein
LLLLNELLLFPIDRRDTVYAGVKLALFTVKEEVMIVQTVCVAFIAKDVVILVGIVNWWKASRNLEKMLVFALGAMRANF